MINENTITNKSRYDFLLVALSLFTVGIIIMLLMALFFVSFIWLLLLILYAVVGSFQIYRVNFRIPQSIAFIDNSTQFNNKLKTLDVHFDDVQEVNRIKYPLQKEIVLTIKVKNNRKPLTVIIDKTIADEFERRYAAFKQSQSTDIEHNK